MNKALAGGALLSCAALAGALWWWLRQAEEAAPAAPTPVAQAPAAPEPAPQPAAAASTPAIQYPIEVPAEAAAATPPTIESALVDLFGRKVVLSTFQLGDFPRRLVATVDNLGRSTAPSQLWPVNPTSGRFAVDEGVQGDTVSADNGLRYTPFVLLVETVDMSRVVAVYKQFYPLFQRAYQDLGFPNAYFNDRLVEVIDELLATPEIEGPIRVVLPQIKGPLRPERPWVLYEFEDPALQALSSGQKILLRMGPVNQRRMKAKLAEIRRLVSASPAPR